MDTGRSERIRTSDPLVPNEVRYQTALHSDLIAFFMRYLALYSESFSIPQLFNLQDIIL